MKYLTGVAAQSLRIKKNKNIRIVSRNYFKTSDDAMLHINKMLHDGFHCNLRPLDNGEWMTETVDILP